MFGYKKGVSEKEKLIIEWKLMGYSNEEIEAVDNFCKLISWRGKGSILDLKEDIKHNQGWIEELMKFVR